MDQQRINDLLERYNQDSVTEEEKAFVETWYNNLPGQEPGVQPEAWQQKLDRVEAY